MAVTPFEVAQDIVIRRPHPTVTSTRPRRPPDGGILETRSYWL